MDACGTCKFRLDNVCHRYPPTVFLVMQPSAVVGGEPGVAFASQGALVSAAMWCGEYVEEVEVNGGPRFTIVK